MERSLYKRDSKGQIREWKMEIDGDRFRTHSGLKDGNLAVSEWTVATPKNVGRSNETTAEEQAQAEVAAQYGKKLRGEYYDDIADIESPKIFKPMLATDYAKRKDKIDWNRQYVYAQPKLDGIRCIARKEGLFTRTGKPITACPHIYESLAPAFEAFPDLVFDGELYNHDLKADFNEIVSMVRREKNSKDDLAKSRHMVEYHVYDIAGRLFQDKNFIKRNDWLFKMVETKDKSDQVYFVETTEVEDAEHADELIEFYVEKGYEGLILRLDKPYEQKRSKNLLKYKKFDDAEFEITGFLEGKGNWSGAAKVVQIRDGDFTGEASMSGTRESCTEIWNDPSDYIGKKVTVQYFGKTPDGALRFPTVKAIHKKERW